MATTQLKLSSKTDAIGRSQVIVKLTISRENRPCFKTGVLVAPEWFKVINETKRGSVYGIVVPKRGKLNLIEVREAETAKAALDAYVSRLSAVCNALNGHGDELTHESIDEALTLTRNLEASSITFAAIEEARKEREKQLQHEATASKTFFEWLDFYLEKKELSEGRKKGFRVLCRILARYEMFVRFTDKERKDFKLDVETINRDTIEDFFDYFSNEKSLSEEYPEIFKLMLEKYPAEFSPKRKCGQIQERGHNIIVGRKKSLKGFFNWMLENKYTTNRPFEGITIGSEKYGTPYYLTLDERNKIADWDFNGNKALEAQRDIFVFQSLIGCRVGDLLKLTSDNLINAGGVMSVEYIPRKTKDKKPVTVTVPLNGRAKALVEKYQGQDRNGRLFPFISSQKYNDAIKEILTACGITRMVTIVNPTTGETEQHPLNEIGSSHMARRTFIGNLYRKVKDPNLIGKLSGHVEGSHAFVRYRDIDIDVMKETVSLID